MNLFQEYEQAKANPLTIALSEIKSEYDGYYYRNEEIFDEFMASFGFTVHQQIPISLLIGNVVTLSDVIVCYKNEYRQYYLDFSIACVKRILHLIPEEFHKFFNYCENDYDNRPRSFFIEEAPYTNEDYDKYAFLSLSVLYNTNSAASMIYHHVFYYTNMSVAFKKQREGLDYHNCYAAERKKITDAFKFMCDYRFVPESFTMRPV